MIGNDKIWFLRGGLFAKYVVSLVGLVVFVLAVNFAPAYFRDKHPFMSISVAHSGFNASATIADVDLGFLGDFLGDAQVGKLAYAYVVDSRGQVLASSARGPEVAKDLSKLPQVAALIAPATRELASGSDAEGQAVPTAPTPGPQLGWVLLFRQPTPPAPAPHPHPL